MDDILAHKRNLGAWKKYIGIATKDYHDPQIAAQISASVTRKFAFMTVRDPVESVVSQRNHGLFLNTFFKSLDKPFKLHTPLEHIQDALKTFVTWAAAEDAYQLHTYEQYRLIDVNELKGDAARLTVASLWKNIGVDVPDHVLAAAKFPNLGASNYGQLRHSHMTLKLKPPVPNPLLLVARPADDLWIGYYDAKGNLYSGTEEIIHTFENPNEVLPSCNFKVPLHMATYPGRWTQVHPSIREKVKHSILPEFISYYAIFDRAYAMGRSQMTFTLDQFTPLERDILAAGLELDFKTFMKRHPAVAERWTMTRQFLGV
jgi:hypothetical protein